MNKQAFMANLRARLSGLPKQDVEERLSFYSEMIDDRMEDGLSEEDAVLQTGSVEAIAAQIIADIPLTKIAKDKINAKGHSPAEMTDESKCIGCAFCATMCPDCIIKVEK